MEPIPGGHFEAKLPWFAQIVAAAVLLPLESILARTITDKVCDFRMLYDFSGWSHWDDLLVPLLFLSIPLTFVAWIKHRIGLSWAVVLISTMLLMIWLCLNQRPSE